MTDTTKPTGDTIDAMVAELIEAVCNRDKPGLRPYELRKAQEEAVENLAEDISTRLAERPNQAVARGDSVTVRRYDLAALALVGAPTLQVTDEAAYNRLSAALTTPTETTDPAMERDDAE